MSTSHCSPTSLRYLLVVLLLCLPLISLAARVEVRIEGIEDIYKDNVRALLWIERDRAAPDLTEAGIRIRHRHAPAQIRTALKPFGLYNVSVDADLEPGDGERPWVATYRIAPGEPVRVTEVDYQVFGPGADDPARPLEFPLKPGAVLLHADYEDAKNEVLAAFARAGYLDVWLPRHRVLVDPEALAAQVAFHVETGPRYRFGQVSFQQDLLNERLIRRYLPFQPGDVYDSNQLLLLQSRLLATDYFQTIELIPQLEAASDDHRVPIEVIASANKANQYRLGLGYGTDVGPRTTLEWRRRHLNEWGHRFRAETMLALQAQQAMVDYRIPIGQPTTDYISVRPEWIAFDTSSRKGHRYTLATAYSTVTRRGWRQAFGVDYTYEDASVIDARSPIGSYLVLHASWSRTISDSAMFTNDGYRLRAALLSGSGTSHYLSGLVHGKWIKSFWDDYRLITRADVGATLARNVHDVPTSRRFFAGGDSTLRGWAFESLGPKNPRTGRTVGGRYLGVGSVELERRIQGNWSGAVFTDFGNAFDPDYPDQIEASAGVGVRWRSPIGQVRFDVALPLTKEGSKDYPVRLHLVLGPDL